MTEEKKNDEFVNITDSLEAIGAFKAMKNLLFFVVFFSIIILGACFWLSDLGMVKISDNPNISNADVVSSGTAILNNNSVEQEQQNIIAPVVSAVSSAEATVAKAVKKIVSEPNKSSEPAASNIPADISDSNSDDNVASKPEISSKPKFQIDYIIVARVVRVCNFVLILSASLYTLVLMFSLKVSLVGRLGGINHIARAFFNSLFLLVFIFPWQKFLGTSIPVVTGMIYLPSELKAAVIAKADIAVIGLVFYYLRFVLWWVIVILLLLAAQRRSAKWANATLRRLGIEH